MNIEDFNLRKTRIFQYMHRRQIIFQPEKSQTEQKTNTCRIQILKSRSISTRQKEILKDGLLGSMLGRMTVFGFKRKISPGLDFNA